MKVGIYHNSATGNTLYQAKQIKQELLKQQPQWVVDIVSVHPLLNKMKKGENLTLQNYDIYIFGSWVNYFMIDENIERFIKSLQFENKIVATFLTCGGAGGLSASMLKRIVKQKKGIYAAHMVSRYVSNYFDMTKGDKVFTVQPSAIYNKLPKYQIQ